MRSTIRFDAKAHCVKDRYLSLIQNQIIRHDPAQQSVLDALENLHQTLTDPHKQKRKTLINGLYLWGKVGRGKTFLMDLF
ncbi:MAG: cell division protein ZapE [Pseudomonadales bacterium]|nr:cell division protein ZapE [Pseudomonadales bacterium]